MMKNGISLLSIVAIVLIWFSSIEVLAAPVAEKPTPKVPPAANSDIKPENKGQKKGKVQHYKGVVASISPTSLTLTLKDDSSVTVMIDKTTQVKIPTVKNATLEDIQPESQAVVQSRANANGDFVAQRILVVPGKPTILHRVGVVTAYTAGASITVQDKDGNSTTFSLNADTKILPAKSAGNLATGVTVTVISPRNPAGGSPAARGVVIHGGQGEGD